MKRLKNIIILFFILLFFILLFVIKIPMPCLFKTWLGILCPACGFTRATICLFNGNIIESFKYNILAIPIILFVIFTVILVTIDIITNKENYIKLMNKLLTKYWTYILIVLVLIMVIKNIKNIINIINNL